MTSRELVYKTLEFRNTSDRVPRDLWMLPIANIKYGDDAVNEILNKYEWDFVSTKANYKEKSTVQKGSSFELGEYVDEWGCVFTNIQRGIIGEVKNPLVAKDEEEWEDTSKIVIPECLLSFDEKEINADCAKTDKFVLCEYFPRPFERLQFIRGTENLYIDLIEQPKGFIDFIDKMHDFHCRLLDKWAKTDIDALYFMDDWGSQRSLLINPALWRDIFKPMYRDFINIAHKNGKKIFMHSDGYIMDIIPDLIELGLDALNSQIFCMGPKSLAKFRGKITFWGEMDRQHILPHGTPDDVINATKKVYENLWADGGCIGQCEFADAKPENVDALFDTWSKIR